MLLLPYLDEISICEHQYDVMNAFLSTYIAKANDVSNAYKCLKRMSVQIEHSPSVRFET